MRRSRRFCSEREAISAPPVISWRRSSPASMRPISTAPVFEYSFKKAASTRSPQERNTRLENMRWRIWNLVRRKKQAPKRGGKAPVAATKKKQEKVTNPLFEKRPEHRQSHPSEEGSEVAQDRSDPEEEEEPKAEA
ncbi:Sucrose-phosphate synthase [Morella rubra]|uniref:Sucrose-phosphate synthase n=1 Tax=Morella rubra TaxID=262757 RepID=A0A6A1VL71_9ROSI|nr:Sucrose-phosphate synthase [Morella rubra]